MQRKQALLEQERLLPGFSRNFDDFSVEDRTIDPCLGLRKAKAKNLSQDKDVREGSHAEEVAEDGGYGEPHGALFR